jgi:glycosyltransferase involved in cell wall biosynthesis
MSRPFISVITPTYNRRKFFTATISCYLAQTWPHDRREWIILEDGHETVEDLVADAKQQNPTLNVRYIRLPAKASIGAKRNRLNEEAKGDIIVAWDDDDYYSPERLAHIAHAFQSKPNVMLAGNSSMYTYFQDDKSIWMTLPIHQKHCTNGTLAYRRTYSKSHKYDETVTHAEEPSFLDNYQHEMIQLDPRKSILVIAHKDNTYSKEGLRTPGPYVKSTTLKLKDFIRTATQRAAYEVPTV